jgi:hypothetical protein
MTNRRYLHYLPLATGFCIQVSTYSVPTVPKVPDSTALRSRMLDISAAIWAHHWQEIFHIRFELTFSRHQLQLQADSGWLREKDN